jgi:hypothetical protein
MTGRKPSKPNGKEEDGPYRIEAGTFETQKEEAR